MKSIIYEKYGPPEVLKEVFVQRPIPKEGEILIKISATTVTAADIRIRSFTVPSVVWIPARIILGLKGPRKKVLGMELSGKVESIGSKVNAFKVGDEIFAATLKQFGAYSEYICLSQDDPIALKPKNLNLIQSAALPIGARTAMYFLDKVKDIKDKKVLIYGASGSVGTYAVQMASHLGAEVTGVSSKRNTVLIKRLGAKIALDYDAVNFEDQLQRYDVVVAVIDKLPFAVCNKILKEKGVYINITNPFKNLRQLFASIFGNKRIIMSESVPETKEYLTRIKELVEKGALKPIIDKIYDFEEMVCAHNYVDTGRKKGNIVVRVEYFQKNAIWF